MDIIPKRLTKEEHLGKIFGGREIIALDSEVIKDGRLFRRWVLRCLTCGTENTCDQRWLRRTRCYSLQCRPQRKIFGRTFVRMENYVGKTFSNHTVVKVLQTRTYQREDLPDRTRRIWLVRCNACGMESPTIHDWLKHKKCRSEVCRPKEPVKEPKVRLPKPPKEEKVPAALYPTMDPRWKKLSLPIFQQFPLEPGEIKKPIMRNALAWMEENEWACFDVKLGLWVEHPEHLSKRLLEASHRLTDSA